MKDKHRRDCLSETKIEGSVNGDTKFFKKKLEHTLCNEDRSYMLEFMFNCRCRHRRCFDSLNGSF